MVNKVMYNFVNSVNGFSNLFHCWKE